MMKVQQGVTEMSLFTNQQHNARPENGSPDRKLAFVLSGGGPRGAMQVGALRALMEADIIPDLVVGTSIGAINGAYLARYGYSLETLDRLTDVWDSSARGNFAPGDFVRAMLRNLLPGIRSNSYLEQARTFHSQHGITPDLRFGDLTIPEFYIVTADVSHHKTTIFGENPDDLVLDSMLASAAIPPWLPPIKIGDSLYLDGGAVSDVPIEPAIRLGATEMIVLDLFNPPPPTDEIHGVKALMDRVFSTMEARHLELEMALAELTGTPIHHMYLRYHIDLPLWDLSHTHNLIHVGYETAKDYLVEMGREQEAAAAIEAASRQPLTLSARWGVLLDQVRALVSNHHAS